MANGLAEAECISNRKGCQPYIAIVDQSFEELWHECHDRPPLRRLSCPASIMQLPLMRSTRRPEQGLKAGIDCPVQKTLGAVENCAAGTRYGWGRNDTPRHSDPVPQGSRNGNVRGWAESGFMLTLR
jgi:hypothetical protein